MAVRSGIVVAALAALAACASGGGLDIVGMQRRLDDAGIGFGVTRAQGSNTALFQVRFRTSDAEPGAPEPDFRAAAEAAAPEGCTLAMLEPAGEGAMKATYDCD
jgi:hypothetical protein